MDTSNHRVRLEQEEKHICSYKNLHQLVKVPAKSKSTIVSFLTHERDMICTNGFLFSMKTLMNRIHILTQSIIPTVTRMLLPIELPDCLNHPKEDRK